ncbi:hypothetical protein FA13DRAFT_1465722 [Coprinellus micaceus]|uniref:Uncharacterized protein n=1 Tax=Coprinellus micaceus TaxID=71717 RepID=A0A4Y7SMP7_COPMI|nr:hypothetical protein FA13DRAFT_1465722 [Coprinellus micaceus]
MQSIRWIHKDPPRTPSRNKCLISTSTCLLAVAVNLRELRRKCHPLVITWGHPHLTTSPWATYHDIDTAWQSHLEPLIVGIATRHLQNAWSNTPTSSPLVKQGVVKLIPGSVTPCGTNP